MVLFNISFFLSFHSFHSYILMLRCFKSCAFSPFSHSKETAVFSLQVFFSLVSFWAVSFKKLCVPLFQMPVCVPANTNAQSYRLHLGSYFVSFFVFVAVFCFVAIFNSPLV